MSQPQGRLVAGMYDRPHERLFGLRGSQFIDTEVVVPYGGWYNGLGERIGFGELGVPQLWSLRAGLSGSEQFVVLPWKSAYLDLQQHPAVQRFPRLVSSFIDEDRPGRTYVLQCAQWIVLPGAIYYICAQDHPDSTLQERLAYQRIMSSQVAEIMGERASQQVRA